MCFPASPFQVDTWWLHCKDRQRAFDLKATAASCYLRRGNCVPPAVDHNLRWFTKGEPTKEEPSWIKSQVLWGWASSSSCLFHWKPVFSRPHNPAPATTQEVKRDWNEPRHPTHCTEMAAQCRTYVEDPRMSWNPFQNPRLSCQIHNAIFRQNSVNCIKTDLTEKQCELNYPLLA